jgi:hypothetical protein
VSCTRSSRFFRAALLAVAILTAGCAAEDKPPAPMPDPGQPQAKLLTDLSTVSDAPIDPLAAVHAVPASGEGMLHESQSTSPGPRTYEAEPGITRTVGNDANPGTVRLLNGKAAKFGTFSADILNHIYAHLMVAERTEEISRSKLPTDLRAVVITAIMDKDGKLTELILEQHSGKSKIDQMLVDVCKKSIWYQNPPVDALSGNGNYRLTIKLKLENYASTDEHHWSFITDLGLGLG